MKSLIVDIGNTSIKYAVVERGVLLSELRSGEFCKDELSKWLKESEVRRAIVSSTRGDASQVAAYLTEQGIDTLLFTADTPVPLKSDYLSPATLGRDRLAAAVGADELYPGGNILIVDFGTAVTVDLVSGGVYRGGFISPGLSMRFRALNEYTASLPLLSLSGDRGEDSDTGLTTNDSIRLGVFRGLCYEIEGHISYFSGKFDNLTIIFAGGEAKDFAKRIKNAIFADCDLVIKGLNRILEYNRDVEK